MPFDDRLRDALALFAGDPEAAALVACLAERVFDSGHDLGSMLRVCGASRRVQERVVAKLGPLKDWITDARL